MLRKFTKTMGRYQEGAVHDYPRGTWDKIAKDFDKKLDSFTVELEDRAITNPLRKSSDAHRQTRLGTG